MHKKETLKLPNYSSHRIISKIVTSDETYTYKESRMWVYEDYVNVKVSNQVITDFKRELE